MIIDVKFNIYKNRQIINHNNAFDDSFPTKMVVRLFLVTRGHKFCNEVEKGQILIFIKKAKSGPKMKLLTLNLIKTYSRVQSRLLKVNNI